jgi:hypothetical protein
MADERLHELLVRAELEDCKLLQKEISTYLEFWGIASESTDLAPEAGDGAWTLGGERRGRDLNPRSA